MYCSTVLMPDFGAFGAGGTLLAPFELIAYNDLDGALDGVREDFGASGGRHAKRRLVAEALTGLGRLQVAIGLSAHRVDA